MLSLPIVVFACDLFTLCYAMSAIFNTVSLHSTAFNHCTVHYGTGQVGRYGHIYSYSTPAQLFVDVGNIDFNSAYLSVTSIFISTFVSRRFGDEESCIVGENVK